MRPIDAEPIEQVLFKQANKSLAENSYENARICAFRQTLELILSAPAITLLPNAPLPLEELREMERGSPIWIFYLGHGTNALINNIDEKTIDVKTVFQDLKMRWEDYGTLWSACRRRPEGGHNMILYHFCPAHLKSAILLEGLTKGGFPLMKSGGLVQGVQWLTSERDPRAQTWATQNLIPYSRTAYRLTVDIPSSRRKKLLKALYWVRRLPEEDQEIVTEWPGSDVWYVYLGKIPPKWIVGCRRMEGTI